MPEPLRTALARAVSRLAEAGIDTPQVDAELLLAHVLSVRLGQLRAAGLRGDSLPDEVEGRFHELIGRRVVGLPVQHLTGTTTFRGVEIVVGPGVFVPRPETELVAGAAIEACRGLAAPIVVDLCTGSGAIAAAVADEVATARLTAVELDPMAAEYAVRNLVGVRLVVADATDPATLADLNGTVDVVVCNPPYVPDDAWIAPEAQYDPQAAVFGGPTGIEVPLGVAARAMTLLRPGGLLVLEHHDDSQEALLGALADLGFSQPIGHRDLAGRARFVTGRT